MTTGLPVADPWAVSVLRVREDALSPEGSIGEAERRARSLTAELAQGAQEHSRAALADIERFRNAAAADADRALDDLRKASKIVALTLLDFLGEK